MMTRAKRRFLTIAMFVVATLAFLGVSAAGANTAAGDPAPLTYGCPGFPGPPAGGTCLYEPTTLGEPRMGHVHYHERKNGSTFSIPWLVGFIDVNSTGCGVRFYDVTYPGGQFTKEYLFTVYDDTNHCVGSTCYWGYIVPAHLQNRIDRGEYNC